jgi:hypothetical protein
MRGREVKGPGSRPGGRPIGMNHLGCANVSLLMRIDVVLIGVVSGVRDG